MSNTTSLRLIIYDPLETLKQTVKDRDIQPSQVAYWAVVLMNRLKAQHIEKRDSGAFLTVFTNIPVTYPTVMQDQDIVAGRPYFELPGAIFDFNRDGGIDYIAYTSDGGKGCPPEFTYVRFQRTTPGESRHLYMDPYLKPSPENPYFYRARSIVTLLGVEKINVSSLEIGLYMPIEQITSIDLDAPIEFPEELVQILQRQILDLARWNLVTPKDRISDGTFDTESQVPMSKVASVNELNTNQ